ncbi:unnamed protein product [Trichogramma brassicae]|uniref:Uncharacterized protein n=1 Tax=Trichogramma brassicae TaxID=86971 RepID=A0A6H5J366_9HYME|nr:unnamed protein product [Trichogramma brassicae]
MYIAGDPKKIFGKDSSPTTEVMIFGSWYGRCAAHQVVSCNSRSHSKSKLASGALLTIEILESAGYELEWSDALTVMKFFAKHRLFEENLEKRWYDDVIVASYAKKLGVFPQFCRSTTSSECDPRRRRHNYSSR